MYVDNCLRDVLVPGLIIQPLVENAVEHGILPRANGGHVWVSVIQVGHLIKITVKDDGVGLGQPSTTGNSLASIRERLELLYDKKFRMDIQNTVGITVTVVLPVPEGSICNGAGEKC
jgi:sensor histidine kinase YesM